VIFRINELIELCGCKRITILESSSIQSRVMKHRCLQGTLNVAKGWTNQHDVTGWLTMANSILDGQQHQALLIAATLIT
jgi:hypothetical protein